MQWFELGWFGFGLGSHCVLYVATGWGGSIMKTGPFFMKLGRFDVQAKDHQEHPRTTNMETNGDLKRGD